MAKAMQAVYEEKEKAQASEQKLKNRNTAVGRLNNALVALSKNEKIYKDGIKTAFMAITETSAHAMDVCRVSIWFYTEGNEGIKCMDLYEMNSGAHSEDLVLEAAAYPAYFSAMKEEYSIAADNAVEDPRTREFSEAYLKPLGITSMLDVPIRVAGKVVGVVCHEHVGAMRKWTVEEQSFVTAIAGFTSVAIESHERIKGDEEIRKLNRELELKVEERTKQLLETREELVRKEKLSILGQLAGSVGHELRNPLGVMNNAIYFLKTVLPESDNTVREYLNMIKSEIDNSERIISDLLDFSRTKTPQVRPMTVNDLINQGLGKCTVPENVKIETNIPDSLPILKVDPFQMAQVFQNLITNAYQAMPEGGELRISAKAGARDLGLGVKKAGV
jgi:K+-sensing histidine kinase KdpD